MKKLDKKQKIVILASVACVVLMAALYLAFMPRGQAGRKAIAIQVAVNEEVTTYNYQTTAEYLRGVLEENNLVGGEDGPYGLYVKAVDGYTADDAQQEWWCVTRGGKAVMTGVDITPIADGDQFELTLMRGY